MSRMAEVVVQTVTVFAVRLDEGETIEDANHAALNQCLDGASEVKESSIAANATEFADILRHADEIL